MSDRAAKFRILDQLDAPLTWSDIETRQPRWSPAVESAPLGRRSVTIFLAAALGLAAILVAVKAIGPAERPMASLDTNTWSSSEVPALHLTFEHPAEWNVQPFDELVGHAGFVGSVVSNIDHRFRHPNLGPNHHTSAWELRDLSDDALVISIERVDALAMPDAEEDSELPLDLDQAKRSEGGPGDHYFDRGWVQLWLPFVVAGRSDSVFVWFGPGSTDHDREIAWRIVASIRPTE